jgi:hypothetical protein
MNVRICSHAGRAAAALMLSATLGIAFAAPPSDIDAPGQSADRGTQRAAPSKAANAVAAAPPPDDVGGAE